MAGKVIVTLRAKSLFDLARAEESYLRQFPPGGYETGRVAAGEEDNDEGRFWSRMERRDSAD